MARTDQIGQTALYAIEPFWLSINGQFIHLSFFSPPLLGTHKRFIG